MGFPEYLSNNSPPKPLVGWLLRSFGIQPNHEEDPGLWFAITSAAAFISWLKTDAGTIWLYSVNGVRRIAPGPWDIFTVVDGARRTVLDSDIVFCWERMKPVNVGPPVTSAAEMIRHVFKSFEIAIPMEVVDALRLPEGTTQRDFQAKVALLSSQIASKWFGTEEGHMWAFESQGIIRAVSERQEMIYSDRLVPIVPPRTVEHTRKSGTESCEECNIVEPCVSRENDGLMCRRCAGYSPDHSGDPHAICARCDITDCHHWKDFFSGSEKQQWLLTVR